jgi:multicomponent Na+:H+ antiporter subunit D
VTHAFGKITLFFCAGAIMVALHKNTVSALDGIGRKMPYTMAAFFIAALSIIGLPPLAGIWSKLLIVEGAIVGGQLWLVAILMISSLLNIAYLLPIPFLALMPPKGTPEPAPYKRAEGAPFFTVAAPVITAFGTLVLFFLMGSLAKFLEPIMGGLT